ncbi:hypothetical protein NPIL_440472 [Nephila pilipes]|uniref:Uncharacterized protein n=1 Tax=Nephila pilipes TaxID=299642 RepID=A0A8X6P731_NEPPI|nr:hypothetical protein NPIL_440472 [Nephila pilipes]
MFPRISDHDKKNPLPNLALVLGKFDVYYLFEIYKDEFRVQSEMVEEFKDEAFQICLSTSGRYLRKPYYRASNLNLCGVKPLESSDSKTEQT